MKHSKEIHRYAFYRVDEDGKADPESGGFSPSLPDWLPQHAFNKMVNRSVKHKDYIVKSEAKYEVKRYPNQPVENCFMRLARNIRQRLGRRV